jgi:Flp pilus assembly protein TadD
LAGDGSADFEEGSRHAREGRWAEAVAAFERALELRPDWPSALANLGVALRVLGRFEEAIAAYDRARVHWPNEPSLLKNRANALAGQAVRLRIQQRFAEALALVEDGLASVPDYLPLERHRANLLIDLGRHDEALAQLDAILVHAPDADTFIRKGLTLQREGRHLEALEAFDKAIAAKPDHADAPFFRSLSDLALGRLVPGWRGFERRWGSEALKDLAEGQVTPGIRARLKVSPNVADIARRELLVVGEQGVGDVLMFASCLPDAFKSHAHISLLCEPRLKRLFAASFPKIRLVEPSVDLAAFDTVVAIGSLCAVYRNDPKAFPGRPYLTPSHAARKIAASRLGPRTRRLRIGLSWRGGTKLTGGDQRSVPLAQLAPLLSIPDVEFVSLQYGDQSDAKDIPNLRLLNPATISDFDDLAATVLEMDLIVSVQTTLIHLAGALGAPCRVMVPHVAEWRYGADGETMPWYGSVRLIRQGHERDWGPVIERIAAEVRTLT